MNNCTLYGDIHTSVATITKMSQLLLNSLIIKPDPYNHLINQILCTSRSSSVRIGSSSSAALGSGFSGSLDSSTCSSTFSCFVRRAISCDFNPLELRERQSSSLRRSFTYKGRNQGHGICTLNFGKRSNLKISPCTVYNN